MYQGPLGSYGPQVPRWPELVLLL